MATLFEEIDSLRQRLDRELSVAEAIEHIAGIAGNAERLQRLYDDVHPIICENDRRTYALKASIDKLEHDLLAMREVIAKLRSSMIELQKRTGIEPAGDSE